MAVATLLAVLAFVYIDLLVAAVTVLWRFMVFLLRLVAGVATGLRVYSLQLKIGFRVIEC